MNTLKKIPPVQLSLMVLIVIALGLIFALKFVARAQDGAGGSPLSAWQNAGIGAAGTFQVDAGGVYGLTDNGLDIWSTNDSFDYVCRPLTGNGQIVARVLGIQGTNDWSKAGVMVRETLDAGSRNAMMLATLSHGMSYQSRSETNGDTTQTLGGANATPCWVKIVRSGDWLGGYGSPDGTHWTLLNWQVIPGLASQVYVGLASTGHGSAPGLALMDQVSVGPMESSEVINPMVGSGDGLVGSYYGNRHLQGVPVTNRVDAQVNFNLVKTLLSGGSLSNPTDLTNYCKTLLGMPNRDEFSIRWMGEIQAQFSEPYVLHVTSDDGVRVWLNEQLVIDDWITHPPKESQTVPMNLVAGQKYLLRIEYFQNHSDAIAKFEWTSPSTPQQLVPQSQLYSQLTDTDGNSLPDLWELHYFGHIGVDPNADPDGDGLSNLLEYRRHSNPTNSLNWGVPNEWTHGDIGADMGTSPVGDANYSNGVFTVTSSGGDIWFGADSLHYAYQPIGTNGQIIARILGIAGPDSWTKAGLMIRESLADGARNSALLVTLGNGMDFQWRPATGLETLQTVKDSKSGSGFWLKLVRNGDWLGGFVSPDGTNWTSFDWEAISGLSPHAFVGLAVSSHGSSGFATASFDQVSVGSADPAEVMSPQVGIGDGLLGNYRNDSLLYLPGITNRVDKIIDFDWGHQELLPILNPASYGICWSGEIQAQFTEPYILSFQSQLGEWVRVWLNEQLIIDGWRVFHPDGELSSKPINLVAGQKYLIRVEMYNDQGRGMAKLNWSSPSTSERPVAQNQLYSQPTDTDGNGLPDLWEMHYFGRIGVDPNADPDGDGLSNLQEYQYHTNPTKADTDGDGIPDAWEIAQGLDPQFNDASQDYDNDGLSNLQKYQNGLDVFNSDQDGDGLPDSLEINYLGIDPNTPHANPATVAAIAYGAQATNLLGSWQVEGNDIYALDRRGGLDFILSVSNADKYVLNLIGTQNLPNPFEIRFKLLLGIDGQTLGHYFLNGGYGTNGTVELVLPYMNPGSHTVHVFWDGVASYSSLRIRQVKLLAVAGADNNHNGIKDWVEKMVSDQSGLDLTNTLISSYTSPLCLEGRDPYPTFLVLTNGQTNGLSPVATTARRWYVNTPLQANTQTVFKANYQNGAVTETRRLQWVPVNLLTTTNSLTVRNGDSMLFSALPSGNANGNAQIIVGTNTFTGNAVKPVAYRFTTPGAYTVNGTYTPTSGSPQNGSVTVNVVQQNLPNIQPAAWTEMQRALNLPNLAPEAVLQADSRLTCAIAGTNASGAVQLTLGTDENETSSLVARMGTNGPVLDSTYVQGFDVWSDNQTYIKVIQVYPDGSQLVEMLFVSSPVVSTVTFELDIIVGGVMFDDGTTTRMLSATDFDALGQCRVRFIRPALSQTSVCHSYKAYQGNYQIGYRH